MRILLLSLLVIVLGVSSCTEKQTDTLAKNRKACAKIDEKLNDFAKKQVDDITSAAKGNITGYYDGEEVKKITAAHFTDTNRVFGDYYFDEGMIIYINLQTYRYNKPNTYTEEVALAEHDSVWYDDKKTERKITSYYFKKNKLIKWLQPGNRDVPVNDPEFSNKESELWAKTLLLLKQLKEQ